MYPSNRCVASRISGSRLSPSCTCSRSEYNDGEKVKERSSLAIDRGTMVIRRTCFLDFFDFYRRHLHFSSFCFFACVSDRQSPIDHDRGSRSPARDPLKKEIDYRRSVHAFAYFADQVLSGSTRTKTNERVSINVKAFPAAVKSSVKVRSRLRDAIKIFQ